MSQDFYTQLEHQLLEAAERDLDGPPGLGRRGSRAAGDLGRRAGAALPLAAAVAGVALVAGLALSAGGEERTTREAEGPTPAQRELTTAKDALPPFLGPPIAPDTRVFVLNASRRDGIAGAAARILELSGARVVSTGNFTANSLRTSRVYARPGSGADATSVATRLGLPPVFLAMQRQIQVQAPGADVVVVLGRRYTGAPGIRDLRPLLREKGSPLPRQQVDLRSTTAEFPKALGYAVIAEGGLAFQAEGLPPSGDYALWLYDSPTDALLLGSADFRDEAKRVTGAISKLPATASRFASFILTEQPTRPTGAGDKPGRILLRGRIDRRATAVLAPPRPPSTP